MVVAAPNREHVPLAVAAVEAGLHVVVDKPLAPASAEGERLAEAAATRGVVRRSSTTAAGTATS